MKVGADRVEITPDSSVDLSGVVARSQPSVAAVRRREPPQVLLSTTHTHSAPATCPMMGCGEYEAAYVERLDGLMRQAARGAVAAAEPVTLLAGESLCDLAVDRRRKAPAPGAPRVA